MLVGTKTADDAAAYRIDHNRAVLQTLDFITPIVDDPYDFGQIAAANSISDIYAMGGQPLFALNIVCFPSKKLPLEVLSRILAGGSDKAREAGIDVIGGHSVEDAEPKYGLVVTGLAPVNRILTNAAARPGDRLVLTKPLGSGILTTALKKGLLDDESRVQITRVMATLNRAAAEAIEDLDVHSLTDVTGFGLLGHLTEMMSGSQTTARLQADQVPVLESVWPQVKAGVFPGGTRRNLNQFTAGVQWSADIDEATRLVLADPQTSGGLLISIAAKDIDRLLARLNAASSLAASVIGEVVELGQASIEVS